MLFESYKGTFIEIISTNPIKDSEGFVKTGDNILASLRAYKEDRHGSEAWKNRATFSEATALFRFRKITNLNITTSLFIVCSDDRYNILFLLKFYPAKAPTKLLKN